MSWLGCKAFHTLFQQSWTSSDFNEKLLNYNIFPGPTVPDCTPTLLHTNSWLLAMSSFSYFVFSFFSFLSFMIILIIHMGEVPIQSSTSSIKLLTAGVSGLWTLGHYSSASLLALKEVWGISAHVPEGPSGVPVVGEYPHSHCQPSNDQHQVIIWFPSPEPQLIC